MMGKQVCRLGYDSTIGATDLQFAADCWNPHFTVAKEVIETAVHRQIAAL